MSAVLRHPPLDLRVAEGITECPCVRTELRERTIRGGAIQHIRQCLDCGHSVGGPVKQSGPVPFFDEELRARIAQNHFDAREQQRSADREAWKKTHASHIASPEWADMRARVLSRDGHLCQGCLQKQATEVHHVTYANFGKEFAFELLSLCSACHARLHEQGAKE